MTRQQAIDIAKEVLTEHQRPLDGTVVVHEYMIALLIRLEILKVDND